MFWERNIWHHEKSNLLELMYEFNTMSVKNTIWIFWGVGRGATQANSRVPVTKEPWRGDQGNFKAH